MSTQEKDQKETTNQNASGENVARINQILIFAFFIFLVLLSYLVRS